MKLSRRLRRKLNRKFRSNWNSENALTLAFKNAVRTQLYSKLRKATTVEEADKVIEEFDITSLSPFITSLATSAYNNSKREFDDIVSNFVKTPLNKALNLRSKSFLPRRSDFEPYLNAFKHNVSLISDLPRDLSRKMRSAYMKGTSFRGTAFAKELTERLGKRAKVVIRTESSKISSTLTQARMQKLGLNAYIWSTSEDSRVRSAHAVLDGVLFFWNDPPTIDNYTDHCGRFVNCRCVPIPVTAVDDIQFPIRTAQELNISTKWVKGGKGKIDTKIVSGSMHKFNREEFIKTFGHLFR